MHSIRGKSATQTLNKETVGNREALYLNIQQFSVKDIKKTVVFYIICSLEQNLRGKTGAGRSELFQA